jgi:hypothetical protein
MLGKPELQLLDLHEKKLLSHRLGLLASVSPVFISKTVQLGCSLPQHLLSRCV